MATLRKREGKWTVSIRKKSIRPVYQTFDLKSDARSFISKVESDIQQRKYKDVSEAANTTFKVVLHRYIREKIEKPKRQVKLEQKNKKREKRKRKGKINKRSFKH